jgi:dipeptidyl-peptidase 4
MRFIFCLLLLSSYSAVAQNFSPGAHMGKKSITLDDIWKNYTFKVKDVPGFNAMKDGLHYTQIDRDNNGSYIRIYSLQSGTQGKTLFNSRTQLFGGNPLEVEDYQFSDDEKKMLLFTEGEHIYRRSVLHRVYVYDITNGTLTLLDYDKVLHASFSPGGSKVAFVKNNNLYYKDLATGQTIPVTNDGAKNKIINGNCDWVYEEEFEFTQAYQWSPKGDYIAYYRFDESLVPEYTIPKYTGLYPEMYTYKYPKAGERNSVVQIKLYALGDKSTITAEIGKETDQYIPRIKWTLSDDKLCLYRLNRLQNHLELLLTDARSGRSNTIYRDDSKFYVDITDNMEFLPDRHSFIISSERDGYNHLYRYDWTSEKLTDLTRGEYDVDAMKGVDTAEKLVYYTSAEGTPLQRKLYVVGIDGKGKECLTTENGVHDVTPCFGYQYFLDKYSNIDHLPVYRLIDNNGAVVRTLENNKDLAELMAKYDLGNMKLIKVKGAQGTLDAWMITPPDFDSNRQYPVLMYQYSGPGSQEVSDHNYVGANYFWHQMLAERGYIIVCADGTGTGFRGEAFKKKTYLQLGKYESDDQIAVAKYLGTLPYVDKSRMGIWGWSFGGFMSSTCILKGNDVFKAAVAVAPVTNWRYYDNIYTERYMRTPQENHQGYDDNAPERMADKLKGKFLLIHGTADDNVHFQNAVMLTNALIKANKEFESEYYPDKNHGIYGGITRYHLYNRMTEFLLKNL